MAEINILSKADTARLGGYPSGGFGFFSQIVSTICLLLLIVTAGAFVYLEVNLKSLNDDLSTTSAKVKAIRDDLARSSDRNKILAAQGQSKTFATLFDRHLYWSHFFDELAKDTLSAASYTSLTVNRDGSVSLSVSAPSYADMDKFLQVFTSKNFSTNFSNVSLSNVARTIQETESFISFKIDMDYKTDSIKYNSINPTTPATTNTNKP